MNPRILPLVFSLTVFACDKADDDTDNDGDGYSTEDGDCDDNDAALNPEDADGDGVSTCDGDCDDSDASASEEQTWYPDVDEDGYGDPTGSSTESCGQPNTYNIDWVTNTEDCDDDDAWLTHEDGDGDGFSTCDGDCDDDEATLNPEDADGDEFSTCDGDCDDDDASIYPGSSVDSDGDGAEANCDCDDNDATLNPEDADGDGYSTCDGDCDDDDARVNPEDADGDGYSICDGDCDDSDPVLNTADIDGDGYSTCEDDCDDSDSETHPDAVDVPGDGLDQDCNGLESVDCSVATTYDGDIEWPSDDGMCDPATPYLVDGSLIIDGGVSGATDLTGAYCLCEVSGNVEIIDNDDLEDLYGLATLQSIGEDLIIGDYEEDETKIGKWWDHDEDPSTPDEFLVYSWECNTASLGNKLESLEGLDALQSIGGDLKIVSNNNLTNMEGLENLVSIGGSLILGDDWYCGLDGSYVTVENDSLTSLVGLDSLTSIGGTVFVYRDFPSFIGLESLTSIGGSLEMQWATELWNFEGLENLESIGGSLNYQSCKAIGTLSILQRTR